MGWVGLGHSADGSGSVGSPKMDPRTTLVDRAGGKGRVEEEKNEETGEGREWKRRR